ncbi:hypothetical protein AAFC00_005410 [Neodothiora populina]|uniref:Intermediate filament protein n=1 Tax=Neodothiora populina TaxID=2781224 RepID=A0ABR3PLV4_9PEZI
MGLEGKDVAIASFVGIISWLLVTHWIPSFRWIPYAFVAGVITTALGLAYILLTAAKQPQLDNVPPSIKPPVFIRPGVWEREKAALKERWSYVRTPVFPHSKTVSKAVDNLLDLVLRDFVTSWYRNITSTVRFQNEIDRAIRETLVNVRKRTAGLDIVELAVAKMVPTVTTHIRDFYVAERAVRGKNLSRDMTESEELDNAVASKYRDGKLHIAATLAFSDTKLMQQAHLRKIVSRILPELLPDNMKSSVAVSSLVREIVACAVLTPAMLMLADPDTFNQLIEAYGRTLLHDRKTVRKLRAALDEHATPTSSHARPVQFPRLRPNDNERQFERFIRATRHCATLSDARRFRSEISSQLRKATSSPDQDPVYVKRLEAGRRILDQKINHLTASVAEKPKLSLRPSTTSVDHALRTKDSSLTDVLHNASGLSYFMEFMDRRDRMRLVQFWVVVDGFRNPLEEDVEEFGEGLQTTWKAADRLDIEQIYEAYLNKPEIGVSEADRKIVHEFLKAGSTASPKLYLSARKAVLRTQTSVLEEMKEKHFEAYKKSDLFYKWLATEEGASFASAPDSPVALTRSHSNPNVMKSPLRDPRLRHATTGPINKAPQLRRPAASSTDVKSLANPTSSLAGSRQSLDDPRSRPLFDDDVEDERMSQSVPALSGNDTEHEANSAQVVDAMQAALDQIMDEPDKDSLYSEHVAMAGPASNSPRSSIDSGRPPFLQSRSKPSIASLGLVGAPSSLGVFSDDLFGEEERFLQDEREDSDVDEKPVEDDIHEAAPGDLGLTEAIYALNSDIERLAAQESILNSLTRKAELTNNAAELRILRKSKQSLQREIHRKEMQKQQYMVQESDNSLYGRAAVNIKSIMVGKEPDGHEYALYVIEVRRQAGDHMPSVVWAVTRRYSEFHELNKRLKARFPAVKNLEFPRRQTLFTLQKDFLQKRRVILEKYLRALLLMPAICRSRELRAFLSQSSISLNGDNGTSQVDERDFVTRIYNSVTDGMEEFLGNIPVLDQLSVAGQNLISAATAQMNGVPLSGDSPELSNDPLTAAEAEAEINAFEDREAEPFVKPICDLFLEVFELSKGTSWLRGRAVVVVLHQLLGGTIERKVRDAARAFGQEDSVVRYIDMVKDSMWPGGVMRQSGAPRTAAERAKSRKEAGLLLATLVPDIAGSVVGRANAQAASRKIFAILNNQRLNTHLIFTLLDELIQTAFPPDNHNSSNNNSTRNHSVPVTSSSGSKG